LDIVGEGRLHRKVKFNAWLDQFRRELKLAILNSEQILAISELSEAGDGLVVDPVLQI
jgi:hypothetical protein